MPSLPRLATLPPKSPGRWDAPSVTRPARYGASKSARVTCWESRREALAALQPGDKAGFQRQIKRVPLGIVAVVAPWNYPYLTAVNAVLPALIAGNAVVLKHSRRRRCAPSVFSRRSRARVCRAASSNICICRMPMPRG